MVYSYTVIYFSWFSEKNIQIFMIDIYVFTKITVTEKNMDSINCKRIKICMIMVALKMNKSPNHETIPYNYNISIDVD